MNFLLKKILASVAGRWILGAAVAASLGTAAIMWHNHKEGLREEGMQECVQEVNLATMEALEAALAEERSANAALNASLAAAVAANQEARDRRSVLQSRVDALQASINEQRETDETYREWADTDLPDGVADRLRQAARSPSGDSN